MEIWTSLVSAAESKDPRQNRRARAGDRGGWVDRRVLPRLAGDVP